MSNEQMCAAASEQLHSSMLCMLETATAALGPGLLLTVNANLSYPLPTTVPDSAVLQLQRIWTSSPLHYPVSGQKSKPLSAWTRQLLVHAQVFVGEGDAAIEASFNDAATIFSMGLHSVINSPLCDAHNQCYATINLLSPFSQWPEGVIYNAQAWAMQTAPAVRAYCDALRQQPSCAPA